MTEVLPQEEPEPQAAQPRKYSSSRFQQVLEWYMTAFPAMAWVTAFSRALDTPNNYGDALYLWLFGGAVMVWFASKAFFHIAKKRFFLRRSENDVVARIEWMLILVFIRCLF